MRTEGENYRAGEVCSGFIQGAVFCRHGFVQSNWDCGNAPRYPIKAELRPQCCDDAPPMHADASGKPPLSFCTLEPPQ